MPDEALFLGNPVMISYDRPSVCLYFISFEFKIKFDNSNEFPITRRGQTKAIFMARGNLFIWKTDHPYQRKITATTTLARPRFVISYPVGR